MLSNLSKIYFPTDFSEGSEKALPLAAEIARQTGAVLTLAHSVEEPLDLAPMSDESKNEIVSRIKGSMEKMIDNLKKENRYKDLQINTTLLSGQPVTALANQVEHNKPGLIVMATSGDSGSRNLLFGSLTTEVIRNLNVPVLAVPPESNFNGFKKIVFATDYHDGDLEALENIIGFANLFGSKVSVIHVAEKQNLLTEIKYRGFRDLVLEQLPRVRGDIGFSLKNDEDFHSGISGYMADHPASILVLVKYKKPFFEALVTKNHVKEMGFYTETPLLVVPGSGSG